MVPGGQDCHFNCRSSPFLNSGKHPLWLLGGTLSLQGWPLSRPLLTTTWTATA